MGKEPRINTVEKLIDSFGGPTAFGDAIGVDARHASVMKGRGSISAGRWADVLKAAKKLGISLTADDLVRMHSKGCG
jgi:hypothetical protein